MTSSSRRPPLPPAAVAAANPGGWVYAIDTDWVDDPDGYVPPEAISGGWRVDDAGRLTGEYVPNDKHCSPRDDLSALTEPDHFLGWLGGDPGRVVRDLIEESLAAQVAGAKVEWLKITAEPKFLTAGKPLPDEPDKALMVRAALAVEFALSVRQPEGRRELLRGAFTLAMAGMDQPATARMRHWLDLGTGIEQAGALLQERAYSLDGPN